ncbi:MAG: hypothetical protein JW996_00550, partial [Candidatus Cloacimonetes bacterium]|nr:hypothetical protein [Candidatus Cloacimonadota bacterium]
LNTIYSQDNVCQTVGNYDTRDFYHIITNSDGDSLITEEDAEQVFNSGLYADGFYYFKVIVRDASLNVAADSMMVYFNNGVHVDNNVVEQIISLSNYPNPFNSSGAGRNPGTTISFRLTTGLRQGHERQKDLPELTIYNLKGQKVKTFPVTESQSQTISLVWDGTDQNNCFVPGGVYLYRLKTGTCEKVNKMILLK